MFLDLLVFSSKAWTTEYFWDWYKPWEWSEMLFNYKLRKLNLFSISFNYKFRLDRRNFELLAYKERVIACWGLTDDFQRASLK